MLTTKQAFEQIISERAWYKDLDISFSTANSIASRFRSGKLSVEKMEEIILKAGGKVVQEKRWEIG